MTERVIGVDRDGTFDDHPTGFTALASRSWRWMTGSVNDRIAVETEGSTLLVETSNGGRKSAPNDKAKLYPRRQTLT